MKGKLLLVGAGGLGRVTLENAIMEYDCFFVDDNYATGNTVCETPIIGNTHDLENLFCDFRKLIVTIGDNYVREKIYKEALSIGYEFPNIIQKSAYISKYASIGTGCIILNNVVVQNGSRVGNGVILNSGVEMHHDSFVDEYSVIYTNSVVRTCAKVGKRVTIGSNVSVGNNSVIVDDSIIENGKSIYSC